jgi:transposase
MASNRYQRNLRNMAPVKRVGMLLLAQGATRSEVARELGVSRTAAWNWAAQLERDRRAHGWQPAQGLAAPGAPVLSPQHGGQLEGMLRTGARGHGFPSDQWSMARVAVLLECEFGLVCSNVHVWRMLGGVLAGGGGLLAAPAPRQAIAGDRRWRKEQPPEQPVARGTGGEGGHHMTETGFRPIER